MARTIGGHNEESRNSNNAIDIWSKVNTDKVQDALKKKYLEDVKNGKFETEVRDPEEIQALEDSQALENFIEFFDLHDDVEIDPNGNPSLQFQEMTQKIEEGAQEIIKLAEEQRELVAEEDAAEKIEQITEFVTNEDDPLLTKMFAQESDKMIKGILAQDEKEKSIREGTYKEEKETSSTSSSRTGYNHRPSSSSSSSIFDRPSSSSSSSNRPSQSVTEETQKSGKSPYFNPQMTKEVGEAMVSSAVHGPKKEIKPYKPKVYGKKKFTFKGMVASVKRWFHSKDTRVMMKVGMMLCLELSLAILTKRYEFDNTGQLLAFLGMMMGIFYVARELNAEGFDPRRMSFI